MTHGSWEFSLRFAATPQSNGMTPFRFHRVCILVVSLAAVCVGCQSIPAVDRSRAVSNDLSFPALPPAEEEDDDDGDPQSRRASDSDSEAAADPNDPERRPFLGFPINKLLDDYPNDPDENGRPAEPNPPDVRDVGTPGPDISNFPNSPFTVSQGRFYIETSPVFISGARRGPPAPYNARSPCSGMDSPIASSCASSRTARPLSAEHSPSTGWRPWPGISKPTSGRQNEEYHIPAVGLEVFLLTASGSEEDQPGNAALDQLALRTRTSVWHRARVERGIGRRPLPQ